MPSCYKMWSGCRLELGVRCGGEVFMDETFDRICRSHCNFSLYQQDGFVLKYGNILKLYLFILCIGKYIYIFILFQYSQHAF